ncbi:MAG TPA: ABC transporter permease [Candidatus Limnocylindria bacterium]|nr:ABC transporter permease [Candidatus Limnocylindria bacterium]
MSLALRNLLQDKTRLLLSVAGVALATMLVLLLNGFVTGFNAQLSSYADNTPGSVVVLQAGARNLLVTTSLIPPASRERVRAVEGVGDAIPVLLRMTIMERHGQRRAIYLVGYDRAQGGGPWALASGREPERGEVVLDRVLAQQHEVALGDTVRILGRDLSVSGLSDGTTSWMLSFAFLDKRDAEELFLTPGATSLLLVRPAAGTAPETVRDRIREATGLAAELKSTVAANDREFFLRYFSPPIQLMAGIASLVGALVVGIVLYTATVERQREYGMLKAIGARARRLYRVTLTQALAVALLGVVPGIGLAFAASALIERIRPQFANAFDAPSVAFAVGLSLVMALVATALPTRVIAGLAPADVFRR